MLAEYFTTLICASLYACRNADGRKSTFETSAGFTPAAFSASENEKKIIPNDITNRGWRTNVETGLKNESQRSRILSRNGVVRPSAVAVCGRVLTTPLVATRMLCTR